MIRAIHGRGVNRAEVICDGCGRTDVVTCDYLNRSEGRRPNTGQIHKRLTASGWTVRKSALQCPPAPQRLGHSRIQTTIGAMTWRR